MFRKDGIVRFYSPETKLFGNVDVCVDPNMSCSFTSPIATKRPIRTLIPEVFEGRDITTQWDAFISPESKFKRRDISFGGLSSLVLDEEGSHYAARFEFLKFEGQIYLLQLQFRMTDLVKVTSDNPDEDWQWLCETLIGRLEREDGK